MNKRGFPLVPLSPKNFKVFGRRGLGGGTIFFKKVSPPIASPLF
jgi:hypothetical protein